MQPYYVELNIDVIVMANSEEEALQAAKNRAVEIVNDQGARPEYAVEITSIKQLEGVAEHWEGDCVPYGAPEGQTLFDMLPDAPPPPDTRTMDMFEAPLVGGINP